MPTATDIRDIVDRIASEDRVWTNPLVVCELQHALQGTFCFPLGPEFGCGATYSIAESQSFQASATFGVGRGANRVQVRLGTDFRTTETVTFRSGRCEWCRPEICYGNSRADIWSCERFIDFYSWTTTDVNFFPGRAQLRPNCERDDEACNCRGRATEQAMLEGGGGAYLASNEEGLGGTALIQTVGFRKRYGREESNPEKDLKDASQAIESFLGCRFGRGKIDTLAVETPSGGVTFLGGKDARPGAIALLSHDAMDRAAGGLSVRPGNRIPLLMAASRVPGATAKVQIRVRRDRQLKVIYQDEAPTRTAKFTTAWKDLALPEGMLKPGEKGDIVVTLLDMSGYPVAELCESLRMPYL